jgi:selenocysteine lyase/cysteine desulfurase
MHPVALQASRPGAGFNPEALRADVPILAEHRSGQALHYLDNATSAQKPAAVIDAVSECYRRSYAPVHRGLYRLAEAATSAYEEARERVACFVGAPAPEQLIFTRSATEAINLVAAGWQPPRLRPGDEVWVSRMGHHANFLPWQRAGARLGIIELTPEGELDLEAAAGLFGPRTRLIAVTQASNVLGTVNPVDAIVREAHAARIPVLVDAAQSVAHRPVNMTELGYDFFAFSAHKMLCLGQEHSSDLKRIVRGHPGDTALLKRTILDAMTIKPVATISPCRTACDPALHEPHRRLTICTCSPFRLVSPDDDACGAGAHPPGAGGG